MCIRDRLAQGSLGRKLAFEMNNLRFGCHQQPRARIGKPLYRRFERADESEGVSLIFPYTPQVATMKLDNNRCCAAHRRYTASRSEVGERNARTRHHRLPRSTRRRPNRLQPHPHREHARTLAYASGSFVAIPTTATTPRAGLGWANSLESPSPRIEVHGESIIVTPKARGRKEVGDAAAADCADAKAARCDGGACGKCTTNDDCTHTAGKGVCDIKVGECVPCAGKDYAACGSDTGTPLVCDSKARTWRQQPIGAPIRWARTGPSAAAPAPTSSVEARGP